MLIWFLLLIPIVTTAVVWIGWAQKVTWWELAAQLGVSFVIVLIAKLCVGTFRTSDIEYWTEVVTKAEYHEAWTEQYTTVETYTDADGDLQTRMVTRTRRHSPYWRLILRDGRTISINSQKYKLVTRRFGNEKEKDLHHGGQISWGDGDMYYTNYPGKREVMLTATTRHRYKNKVQVSKSIFNFPEVTEEDIEYYSLFEYPDIDDCTGVPCILGTADKKIEADKELRRCNAELGRPKQIRMWVLVFKNQPLDAAIMQESYWCGGNKNELVLCVGLDDAQNVKWAYCFSWTEVEALKTTVRNFVQEQTKLDLPATVKHMAAASQKKWVRKEFADFNYITVEPSALGMWLSGVFVLLLNVGMGIWIVLNEHEVLEDGSQSIPRNRYRNFRFRRHR